MLESKIAAVQIAAMTTSLPLTEIIGSDKSIYYVADEFQTTSDLGFDAAQRIISTLNIDKEEIGILLFGSKTADYRSPTTAAILQGRLGLAIDCICFDTNVGANGFIKMTQIAAALLAKSTTKFALVIVGDTPSKLQNSESNSVLEISDAATAILLQKATADAILEFSTHSDGANYKGLYLKEGGFRDFNPANPFDGSKAKNYVQKSNTEDLNKFLYTTKVLVENSIKEGSNTLINSFLLDNLKIADQWKEQRAIKADASELPLLLEILIHTSKTKSNHFQFISGGEGMAMMTMKINQLPEILPKNHTLAFFEDYRVSHEM